MFLVELTRINDPLYKVGKEVGCDAQVSDLGKSSFVYKRNIERMYFFFKGDNTFKFSKANIAKFLRQTQIF